MLEINKEQIDVVRRSDALCDLIREQLSDPSLSLKDRSLLSDDEWAELEDACLEVLRNEAPIVKEIDAEQSKGVYTISIHGIPGAYWVFAPEFDIEGVFSTLSEALAEVDSQHGEFLVDPDSTIDSSIDESPFATTYDPHQPHFGDELLCLLAGTDAPEVLGQINQVILLDSALVLLANGSLASAATKPKGMTSLFKRLEQSLGKVTSKYDGMARHPKLLRAEARARLYFIINKKLPDDEVLRRLYELK